jgi:hypothetical protein
MSDEAECDQHECGGPIHDLLTQADGGGFLACHRRTPVPEEHGEYFAPGMAFDRDEIVAANL